MSQAVFEEMFSRHAGDSMLANDNQGQSVYPGRVCEAQGLARSLELPDITEYWKSAPYLVNLMDE